MAVRMRLRREGKRKQPYYRVVVADVRSPRDGRFIEDLGYYQPLRDPSRIVIDSERALYWLHNGVQPSDAVVNLLRIQGIWEEFRPGDPGKDRSAKRAAEAKAAETEAATAKGDGGAEAQTSTQTAQAEAAKEAEAEEDLEVTDGADTAAPEEASDETVAQAVEEDTQPEPGPAEETGALAEDAAEDESR